MPWHATLSPDFPVVETSYSGMVTAPELSQAVKATFELGLTHGVSRFLADCSALVGGHTIVDLYGIAEALTSTQIASTLKEAVLVPALSASAEDVRFWETACINRGMRVRVFQDRQCALDWLLE